MLNATFLVQIINFWIAYLFLSKLLFKPVVRLIRAKEAAKKRLQNDMKLRERALHELQEDKHRQQVDFKLYLQKQYMVSQPYRREDIEEPVYVCEDKEKEKLIAQARNFLVKKVSHAD